MIDSIALIGKKRSGKGSVAGILSRRYGHAVMSLADPLRELVEEVNPILFTDSIGKYRYSDAVRHVGYESAKDRFEEVREQLKNTGQGVRKVLGADTWVDHLIERMTMQITFGFDGPFVVDDCRMLNEVHALKYHDFLVVRVIRPDLKDDGDLHVTETELDDFPEDVLIVNDGDLDDLESEVMALLGTPAFL